MHKTVWLSYLGVIVKRISILTEFSIWRRSWCRDQSVYRRREFTAIL